MPDMRKTPDFKTMGVVEKVAYFKEKQTELVNLEQSYKNAQQLNMAELQLAFGLTPGKPVSIVDLVTIVSELVGEKVGPHTLGSTKTGFNLDTTGVGNVLNPN